MIDVDLMAAVLSLHCEARGFMDPHGWGTMIACVLHNDEGLRLGSHLFHASKMFSVVLLIDDGYKILFR